MVGASASSISAMSVDTNRASFTKTQNEALPPLRPPLKSKYVHQFSTLHFRRRSVFDEKVRWSYSHSSTQNKFDLSVGCVLIRLALPLGLPPKHSHIPPRPRAQIASCVICPPTSRWQAGFELISSSRSNYHPLQLPIF